MKTFGCNLVLVLTLVVVTLTVELANAQTFGNLAVSNGTSGPDDALRSDDDGCCRIADDFQLPLTPAVQTASRIIWRGIYTFQNTAPDEDNFTIRIYNDGGGVPGSVIYEASVCNNVNRFDTGQNMPDFNGQQNFYDIYEYRANISVNLDSSETYWLSIVDNTPGGDNFRWLDSVDSGNAAESQDLGSSWSDIGGSCYFQLFTNMVSDSETGGASGVDFAEEADVDNNRRMADSFMLDDDKRITRVDWTGINGFPNTPPATDNFTIEFLSDNAGTPGFVLASFNVGNAVQRRDSFSNLANFNGQMNFYDVYEYSAAVDFFANGGATYWLVILQRHYRNDWRQLLLVFKARRGRCIRIIRRRIQLVRTRFQSTSGL